MKKTPLLLLFLFLSSNVFSQRCEWLNTEGNTSSQNFFDLCTDSDNNVIVCGRSNDSLSIGNFLISQQIFNGIRSYENPILFKYDEFGDLLWVDTTIKYNSRKSWLRFSKVFTDINNNIYVTGVGRGEITFSNKTVLNISPGRYSLLLLKYNKGGKLLWVKEIITGANLFSPLTLIVIDKSENFYLCDIYKSTMTFRGTNTTLTPNGGGDFFIAKYTKDGIFLNAKSFGSAGREILSSIEIDGDNNIYVAGTSDASFNFGSKTLHNKGRVILKLDSALVPLNGRKFDLNNSVRTIRGKMISVDPNGNISLFTEFKDSVNFGNNIWLKDTLYKYSLPHFEVSIVYFDSSLTAKWARKSNSLTQNSGAIPYSVFIKNEHIYFGGTMSGKLAFGSSIVSGNSGFLIGKVDTLGNFLWVFTNNDSASYSRVMAISVGDDGKAVIGGSTNNKVTVFDKHKKTNRHNFFTAKIMDYFIRRGYVSTGPYCAGDSMKIPYTKFGEYNIGNEFIAELSDSAGNFTGGHRELGRIKDTASGIIKGALPLFNVATNSKYRIRIISTNPSVQSFFKKDTLRLLIYSKDSANAGPDQFICKGEEVRLGTTGGSKWLWSPVAKLANPADSSNRQPLIKLYDSAKYRIIISDSSGCGDVDTDYVKIYVRPYIKAQIKGEKTVCTGYQQTLTAQATGGYNSQYWYIWKPKDIDTILSTDSILSIKTVDASSYYLVVGDSCSDKLDTTYFTVKVVNNLKANPSPDTSICKGKTAQLSVVGTGCNPDKYTYEWTEKGGTTILSTNDSITVSPSTTTHYQIILKDSSTLLVDTATITVTVDSVFNINATQDSTICLGQSIDLSASVFSCDTSNMIYRWTANNNQLSTNNTLTVSPSSSTTYTVIGENTFNNLKDTAQVTITVRDPLSLTLNPDSTICVGEQAELRATATGGRQSTYNIIWSEVGGQWSVEIPKTTVSPTQTTTYKALLSDGCTVNNDSAEITITVRPKLEMAVNQDSTICIGEQAELRAIAKGGLTTAHQIQWIANNQQLSTNNTIQVTPTTTTTYKAILSDGCTTPNDSAAITITVRPKLTLTLNADSTICIGEEAELLAIATGGNPNTYNIQWIANNQQLSTNNQLKVNPTVTTTYKALLSDGCTDEDDSTEVTITVRPALQLSTNAKDSICSNEILLLTATPTGGYTPNHQILWTVDGGPWTSTQNPATDTPQITTTYIATLTDNCSPPVQDTQQVIVLAIPKANFTATPQSGCPPLTVTLTDNSTANDSTQNTWTIGTAEYQGTTTQTHELLKQGEYTIKLNVKNQLGCSDEKTQVKAITVFAKPNANFIIKPDIKEVEEPLQLYNLSQNYTQVIWDMGDGNTLSPQYGKDTSYKYHEDDTGKRQVQLIAINNQGCKDTSKQNILLYNKVHCTIPSAFTPNNDRLNNTFSPICVGVSNYTFTIYNRWGQVIYQRDNGAWDGNYADQPAPTGVYMYKIQINAQSNKKKLTFGSVHLIR